MAYRDVQQRFSEKVLQGQPDECWPWTGKKREGYGRLYRGPGQWYGAHRLAYEFAYGPIPEGLQVCHHCDNPPCCNPAHLFLGTNAANQADSKRKGRRRSNVGVLNPKAKLTVDQVAAIRTAYAGGVTQVELAKRFGVTQPQISSIIRGQTWGAIDYRKVKRPVRESFQRGEANSHAKLTWDIVRAIRHRSAEGVGDIAVAWEFGLRPSHVYAIVRNHIWREELIEAEPTA